MWGSSYLFIKLAVDDFGTFTLVALRLVVGAAPAVDRRPRRQAAAARANAAIYGHLLVMAIINITIPFLLITWAEQSVESSLAAILTSPVPLFAIVLSAIFLADEPIRVNGVVGLIVGFIGVVIITSPGLTGAGSSVTGELALLGGGVQLRLRRGLLAAQRPRPRADDPGRLPGQLRRDHHRRHRAPVRAPLDGHARTREAIFSILWLGILGSGLAYLAVFRLFAALGRDADDARRLPHPGRRDRRSAISCWPSPSTRGSSSGPRLVIAGVGLVNSRFGRRRVFGRVPPIEAVVAA